MDKYLREVNLSSMFFNIDVRKVRNNPIIKPMNHLQLIFDLIYNPKKLLWEGCKKMNLNNKLSLVKGKEMYVPYQELSLRSKYGAKIKGPVTENILEKILALGPNHRILVL